MGSKPWLQYYTEDAKAWSPKYRDMLSAFRAAVSSGHGGIRYFGNFLSWKDVDEASNRLAVWAAAQGVRRGDRVSIVLQNVPSFVIAAVAAGNSARFRHLEILCTARGSWGVFLPTARRLS